MHRSRLPHWLAITLVCCSAVAVAKPLPNASPESIGFDATRLARLNAAMHGAVDRGEVAGVMTMLVRHGRVVNFDAYGKDSIAAGTPLRRDHIVRLYSQTKPITGLAMAILYEEGRWHLDDPIAKHIPEFADLRVFAGLDASGQPSLVAPVRPPTMAMLMTHTAGFGYGLGQDNYVDQQFGAHRLFQSQSLAEMVRKLATIPLRYQPGTRWSYSISVDIQGYIVERLSGQRFGEFLRDRIYAPLGMVDSDFWVPPDKVARLAALYGNDPQSGKLVELRPGDVPFAVDFSRPPLLELGGSFGVGTIDDYARLCQTILNGGTLDGTRILAPRTIELLRTSQLPDTLDVAQLGDFGPDRLGFGFGLAIEQTPLRDGRTIGDGSIWWGGAAGTWFWIDPQHDLFFIGFVQQLGGGNAGSEDLIALSQTLTYAALVNPAR